MMTFMTNRLTLWLAGTGVLVFLAASAQDVRWEPDLHAHAVALAHEYGIIDTHIDLPYRLHDKPADMTVRSTVGDFDFVRATEGGLLVPFMSIYTPSDLEGMGKSKLLADSLIDLVEGLHQRWPDRCTIVTSTAEILREKGSGKILLAMGMENGSPIEGRLDNLKHFYDRGIRYVTLAHAKWNHLSDASYDTVRHWKGLSPFGREVVGSMNRLGMMIDVSHLTDSSFYQILRISKAPVIASHSCCRYFTPGFERNMGDDMIRQLGASGGVMQIAFGSFFLTKEFNMWGTAYDSTMDDYQHRHNLKDGDSAIENFKQRYLESHPTPRTSVSDIADHVDHAVKLAGIDHVGIGSDFEGVGHLPDGLKDASQYPNLLEELLKRGYTDEMIGKLCSGNLLRVWASVEREARQEGKQ